MSGLTKLFVGLLVVLSIILAAAAVGTVATLDNYVERQETAQSTITSLRSQISAAESRAAGQISAATERADTLRQQLVDTREQVNQLQTDLNSKDAQIARLTTGVEEANARNTRLAQAVQLSQATQNDLNTALAELRQQDLTQSQQSSQLQTRVTELTRERAVLERERRNLAEQLAQNQQAISRLSATVEDAGLDARAVAEGRRRGQGTPPPIDGVVRRTAQIAGKTFATISVGRNDEVAEGMEFNVIDDQSGEFLGRLIVQRVEPDEAVGVLQGPRVAEVSQGATVRTQFSS